MAKKTTDFIFLVGFMTSGKSSIGRKLAKTLAWQFIDLDQAIENKTQKTINAIFKENGETFFRNLETETLTEISKTTQATVVALGGGTPCFNQNIDFLLQKGKVFYLEVSKAMLIGRLKQNQAKRPLVKDLNAKELAQKVADLFAEREKIYQKAHYTVNANESKNKVKQAILKYIGEHQK